MYRNDGGIVDAELLRPIWWIAQHGIQAGRHLPMHIEELQVQGSALVTAVENCPEIASGDGSVVTARFLTRQVDVIARVEILGPSGQIEALEGTTIHPIWSEDQQDWIPLGELRVGETLRTTNGDAAVLSVQICNKSAPVYNIEVRGEHVYQAGHLGTLVHNTYADTFFNAFPHLRGQVVVHHRIEQQVLSRFPGMFGRAEIHSLGNLTGIPKHLNSKVHLSEIRRIWNNFYTKNPTATRADIEHFARIIDDWVLKGIALP
jgi:hypothetical protein